MHHLGVASRLSWVQREMLINHIDRKRRAVDLQEGTTFRTVRSLVRMGLLKHEHGNAGIRPRFSLLTNDGKAVVCALLAIYADAISRIELDAEPGVAPLPWREKLAELRLGRVPVDPVLFMNALTRK